MGMMVRRASLAILFIAVLPGLALAQSQLYDSQSTCSADNCQAVTVEAQNYRGVPWVAQVWAGAGECLRVEVVSLQNNRDLETVIVDPAGTVWRDDDSGAGLAPRVEALTSNAGWHTVRINHWSGRAQTARFTLSYGRYNSGNSNCANVTSTLSGPGFERPKQ